MTSAPTPPEPPPGAPAPPDAAALLRDRSYIGLLVIGAVIGVPVATVAYFFLKIVGEAQQYLYETLPGDLGFHGTPSWWAVPLLGVSGVLVALAIRYLPGTGGHSPADGFENSGPVPPIELPGIVVAAFVTLSLGAVLGPEAPLIAIGSGLGVLAIHLVKKDAPPMAAIVVGVAGSFAAISTLLGSPIVGAFLLMEVAGLGGTLLGVVLVPGLIAAGVGSLIFVGLDAWTGFGTFSLGAPKLPPAMSPTGAEFLWAIAIGVAAALLAAGIKRMALWLRPVVARRSVPYTALAGLVMGVAVFVFVERAGHPASFVLFSGQDALAPLLEHATGWTVGALLLLVVCKSLAYGISLSSWRGGPVFPGLFIGAAGGIVLSHSLGLPMIAGAAMGMGAMTTAMLGLPLTAVMITTLFLGASGITLMPVVIVSVAVSYVASARLGPRPRPAPGVPDPGASSPGG
jgi:chloride channel protein, CIC family